MDFADSVVQGWANNEFKRIVDSGSRYNQEDTWLKTKIYNDLSANWGLDWAKNKRDVYNSTLEGSPAVKTAADTAFNTGTYWLVDRVLWMAGIAPNSSDKMLYAVVSYLLENYGYGNDLKTIVGVVLASHAFQSQFGGTLSEWILYSVGLGDKPGFDVDADLSDYDRRYNEWKKYPVCSTPCKPNEPGWFGGSSPTACRVPTMDEDGYEWGVKCGTSELIKRPPRKEYAKAIQKEQKLLGETYEDALQNWQQFQVCRQTCRPNVVTNVFTGKKTKRACRMPDIALDGYEWYKECPETSWIKHKPRRADYYTGNNGKRRRRRRNTGRRRRNTGRRW